MNKKNAYSFRLQALLNASLDGKITPAETSELESILRSDPAAREFYLDYVAVHTELYLLLSVMNVNEATVSAHDLSLRDPLSHRVAPKSSTILGFLGNLAQDITSFVGHHPWFAFLVVFAVLGIAVLTVRSWPAPEIPPAYFAQINEIRDCQWTEDSIQPRSGSAKLGEGQLLGLKTGLAEIVYDNGAKVLLQGPAKFVLQESKAGFLHSGKLTATAQSVVSHGFTIYTATAKFSDLGTEFGVSVDHLGRATVAVFSGLVNAEAKLAGDRWSKPVPLSQGEGAVCEASQFKRQAANRDDFPTLQPSPPPPPPVIALQRWSALSQEIQKRPDAIAYYDFQLDPQNPQTLFNRAASGAALNGEIRGAVPAEGRWPEKNALEFNSPDSGVRVILPGDFHQLTIVAWIRIERLPNDMNALLMSDGWVQPGQLHWQIKRDGRLILREPSMTDDLSSDAKFTPERLRQWCMVGFVLDAPQHYVEFFLDGDSIGKMAADNLRDPLHFGPSTLGNWAQSNYTEPDAKLKKRSFVGRIDELTVLRTRLTLEEIRRIYESGKP